jgi:hypothetical protein
MAISTETRAAVRAAFSGRCGYCGVSETSVGGELEMDHFHLTLRGWFHIQRLHLNRSQLVELRHLHRVLQAQKADLSRAQEAEARLRRENDALQT